MSRYIYSNLFKIIFNLILLCIIIPSAICFICSLLIDKELNVPSLITTVSCVVMWHVLIILVKILDKSATNRVVFEVGKIRYKNKTIYKDNVSIKYFKFSISIIEPSLVIPKLHINGNDISVTCYLSKKDIRILEKLNYKINKI